MNRLIRLLQPMLIAAMLVAVGGLAPSLAAEVTASPGPGPDLAHFPTQRRAIEADLAKGERYRELSRFDRTEVIRSLDRIEAIVQGKQSLAELTPAERAELLNHQEIINTLLTAAAEDSRLVCRRSRPVGSNMMATVCKTVAQRRSEQDQSQDGLRAAGSR
jgi:hypothetical protein